MRQSQAFRDSTQNTQSYKVATLEVWPSHWEERPCPISPWRDPSLIQRTATIPPTGPGAKTPLMGGIHWVPGGAWNTYQRPQIKERLMCSLNRYFPTAYSGPMLAADRTEMRYKQDLFPVMRKLISHPSPDFIWYTCTTIVFLFLLVPRHKYCPHEICKSSRKCTGHCIFYLFVMSNTMIVTW